MLIYIIVKLILKLNSVLGENSMRIFSAIIISETEKLIQKHIMFDEKNSIMYNIKLFLSRTHSIIFNIFPKM